MERKEGTLPVVINGITYPVEDHYYEVTIKSSGLNPEYPANENVYTTKYVRQLTQDNQAAAGMGTNETPTLAIRTIPPSTVFKEFELEDKTDKLFFLTANLDQADKERIFGYQLTALSQTLEKALAQKTQTEAQTIPPQPAQPQLPKRKRLVL